MQAAMMRLGTLVYLYGRGRAEVWTEDRSARIPIRSTRRCWIYVYGLVREHAF